MSVKTMASDPVKSFEDLTRSASPSRTVSLKTTGPQLSPLRFIDRHRGGGRPQPCYTIVGTGPYTVVREVRR
jgi:hypothetical protein